MPNEDKTITIRFRGDTSQLDTEVSNVDKMIKVLQAETRAVQKKMKFGDDYQTQMGYYEEAISNVTETLSLAERNQSKWNEEIEKYQQIMKDRPLTEAETGYLLTAERKFAEYTRTVENTRNELSRLNDEKERFNKLSVADWLNKEGTQITKLGTAIGKVADSFKYLSLAAGAALTGSASAAITFETAMANVNKVLKESEKNYLGTLEQQILDMSRVLPLTAEEIAQTTANALQLGIAAKDVGKFTETILKLGTATNVSAEDAAISIAQLFNITGEQYDNIEKFGAALTDLGNKFPTFESDILEMSQRIAAAGKRIGMSSTDILGLATAMASVGLSAEAGGSAISQILTTIDTKVATSGKGLSEWAQKAGMSLDNFKAAWRKDAIGTFQIVINQLAKGVSEGKNLNKMLSDLGITAIRQTDAFSRLVQANDTLNASLYESENAWNALARGEQGALNNEFAEKVKTLASQFQILKNELYYIGVQLGNILMPYLRKAVEWARSLVDWFINLSPTTKKWVTGLLAGIASIYPALKGLSALITGVGKMLTGLGGIIGSKLIPDKFGEKMFGGILKSIKLFAKAAASPLTGWAVAIIASFTRLYKTFEPFRNAINSLASAFKDKMYASTVKLIDLLKVFYEWLGNKIQPLLQKLAELYHKFIEPTLAYLYSALTRLVFNVLRTLWDWIVKIADVLISLLKPAIDIIIGIIQSLMTFLAPMFGWLFQVLGAITELIEYIWNVAKPYVTDALKIIGDWVKDLAGKAEEFFGLVLEALQWVIDKFAEWYRYLEETGVIDNFTAHFETFVGKVREAYEWITSFLDKMRTLFGETKTLGQMTKEWEAANGISNRRYGSPTVILNSTNTFNSNTPISQNTGNNAVNTMLDLLNNGIGKMLLP